MFAATIVFSMCAMALSSMSVHYHSVNGEPSRAVPHRMYFYISLLRFGALIIFILLSYPLLFNLSAVADGATIIAHPAETTFGLLLVIMAAATLSWVGTAQIVACWVLLLQGLLFLTWLFSRIATALGQNALLYPDWRFAGLSVVLCAAGLLISELLLWFPRNDTADRHRHMLLEMTRLLCVLPAVLIYSMGLGMRL